jgi:pentatricopeptide repeat protein
MSFMSFRKKILDYGFTCIKRGHFHQCLTRLNKRRLLFGLIPSSRAMRSNYLFQMGVCLYNLGKFRKSVIYIKRSIIYTTLDKSEHFYYLVRGFCKIGNFDQAEYYLRMLLDRSYQPLYLLLSLYEFDCYNRTMPCSPYTVFEQLEESPRSIREKLARAVYFLLDNNLAAAKDILHEYKHTFNNYYYFNLIYYRILFREKAWDEIITCSDGNIEQLSSYDLLVIYAATLYKMELWNECIAVLNETSAMNRSVPLSEINIVKCQINNRNFIPAIARLKRLSFKYRNHNAILSWLSAVAHHKVGLLSDAERYYSAVDADSPYRKKALFNLALLYYDLDDIEQARIQVLRIDPSDSPSQELDKWKNRILKSSIKPVKRVLKRLIIIFPILLLVLATVLAVVFILILQGKT